MFRSEMMMVRRITVSCITLISCDWTVGRDFYLFIRFHGVPAEERLHWRSFLVKLGADNLKGAKNEELYVASHKWVKSFDKFFCSNSE